MNDRRWIVAISAGLVTSAIVVVGIVVVRPGRSSAEPHDTRAASTIADPDGAAPVEIPSGLESLRGKQATAIVFLGIDCPVANAFLPVLNDLHARYEPQGICIVGVFSNAGDFAAADDDDAGTNAKAARETDPIVGDAGEKNAGDKISAHAAEYKIGFPIVRDPDATVAAALQAQHTPEAVVIDPTGEVRYRGRIDDRIAVGARRAQPSRADLSLALDELLASKPVSVARTDVSGCPIARRSTAPSAAPSAATYCRSVAAIVQRRCQSCHRDDGVAPFALASYDDAREHAAVIKQVVQGRRMPPWHADPRYGTFSNDRSLSAAEIESLVAWVDAGTPLGDTAELPAPVTYPATWTIGEPDVVVPMADAFEVPASDAVAYQHFVVPTGIDGDRWVERAEAHAGSKAVHHIVARILPPGPRPHELAWLCVAVPGESALVLPPGYAKKLPAGSRLELEVHYTPTGKIERDRSSVALKFARQPVTHEVLNYGLEKKDFVIPPGAADHGEEKVFPIPADVQLLALSPHMHVRGKSFEYRIQYPDGRKAVLLSVPKYDFNWQSVYRFAEPCLIPRGSRVSIHAVFDNSAGNSNNPDPTATVRYGPQTWEEMMMGIAEYTIVK